MNEGKLELRNNAVRKTDKKDETSKERTRRIFGRFKGCMVTAAFGLVLTAGCATAQHEVKNTEKEPVQKIEKQTQSEKPMISPEQTLTSEESDAKPPGAIKGKTKEVEDLLAEGADVNAKSNGGDTALMKAAYNGHKEIAELLISEGADVNAKTKWGWTALMGAAENGYKEIVELLISKGADVNAKTKRRLAAVLEEIEARGEYDKVVESISSKSKYWNTTALMWAAGNGHTETVELLISKGADINARDDDGRTALMWAADKGHKEVVELLKKAGAKE